jgi:tRNA (guanine-N7-)-methyltransferase
MSRSKLERFRELESFEKVFQPGVEYPPADHELKGKWNEKVFQNNNPVVLELGCGRGEYTVEMAKLFADKNFIGIDIKGARIWRGAKTINEEYIPNAAFLRIPVEFIEYFFSAGEVSELWLTFPDPQMKKRQEIHRLTNPRFIGRFRKILSANGLLHLKTDSQFLYEYTLDVLKKEKGGILFHTSDLYSSSWKEKPGIQIKTTYEIKNISGGKGICYVCAEL